MVALSILAGPLVPAVLLPAAAVDATGPDRSVRVARGALRSA